MPGVPARDEDLTALVEGDLQGDVGGGSEAVEREDAAFGQGAALEGAVADDPGAEEGRGVDVVEGFGDFVGEGFGDDGVFGVAAVGVVAGVAGGFAEVFLAARAVIAFAAGMAQPCYAYMLACGEGAVAFAEVQLPGRKRLPAAAVMAGQKLRLGDVLT